jgi:hypothetical protein
MRSPRPIAFAARERVCSLNILPSLTRRSRNQKGQSIKKPETSSKFTQSPMNSGDRAQVEKYSAENVQISNELVLMEGDSYHQGYRAISVGSFC